MKNVIIRWNARTARVQYSLFQDNGIFQGSEITENKNLLNYLIRTHSDKLI